MRWRIVVLIAALSEEPLVKVLGWSDRRSADELVAVVRSFGLVDVEPTHSGGPGIVELAAAGVTKAGALAKLCAGWFGGQDRGVAFGDMPNDVPMLRWAGQSWAVANAHREPRADQVAEGNDDDVARVLEALLEPFPDGVGRR